MCKLLRKEHNNRQNGKIQELNHYKLSKISFLSIFVACCDGFGFRNRNFGDVVPLLDFPDYWKRTVSSLLQAYKAEIDTEFLQ